MFSTEKKSKDLTNVRFSIENLGDRFKVTAIGRTYPARQVLKKIGLQWSGKNQGECWSFTGEKQEINHIVKVGVNKYNARIFQT